MKRIIFLLFLVSILLTNPVDSVTLGCAVTQTACDNPIMKLAQLSDSHIGSPDSNFPYYVCCNNYGITNSCGTTILNKIQVEDSHVRTSGTGSDICVSHPNGMSCEV